MRGLPAFVDRVPGAKELEEGKAVVLEFMAQLIERHPGTLQPYLKEIKVWLAFGRRAGGDERGEAQSARALGARTPVPPPPPLTAARR